MIKDKRIQKIIICILILSLMMFISGFFVARKAYASLVEEPEIVYPEGYNNEYVIGRLPFPDGDNYYVAYLSQLDPADVEDYIGVHLELGIWSGESKISTFHFGNYTYDGETYRVVYYGSLMHCKVFIYETLESAVNSLYETNKSTVDGYISDGGDVYIRNMGIDEGTIINNILYSSANIYRNGVLVFRRTPLVTPTLAGITETEIITGTLNQVVSLIPIGVGLMVSFLGLRKALALLRRLLLQA